MTNEEHYKLFLDDLVARIEYCNGNVIDALAAQCGWSPLVVGQHMIIDGNMAMNGTQKKFKIERIK